MNQNKKSHRFINYLMVFLLLVTGAANAKAPVAGTIIKNQATATYKDSAGIEQTATSNLVETVIQQVGAFILEPDQSKYGIAGQLVSFPHVLTNTGNGDDTFLLSASDLAGDDYTFTDINIYPDVNQDGVADSLTTISDTGVLATEEAFYFVVVATIPGTVVDTDTGQLLVEGESDFSGSILSNTDEAIVSDKAVVEVTKSISSNSGEAGSGPYTVTLTYSNQSTSDASNVTLIDALPDGMNYVAGSGEWSLTGAGVALTDANKTDAQGIGVQTVVYCAYNEADCTGLVEATMDADNLSFNQVTAIIASVVSGDSGTISFDVTLDGALEASTLLNTAEFQYFNGAVAVTGQKTNQVSLEVIAEPGVVANGSTIDNAEGIAKTVTQNTATLGSTVAFDNVIWNRGNAVDTFDISIEAGSNFPAGTTFTLYHSDGFTPLLDTDNSSVVDTGPLEPSEFYVVVLKAKLPMTASAVGNNGGLGFDVTKTAISASDTSVFSSVTDHLDEITGSQVDLTNVAPLGEVDATGVGPGPEAIAQSQLILAPGESGVFKLYVNNISTVADSFDLTFSKDAAPFAPGTVPDGWKVAFHVDAGATNCSTLGPVVSNTALIAPGASKLICAKVTLPRNADFSGAAVSIYFRALSALTLAGDIKHDAVYMTAAQNLILEPDNRAQVEPGSSVIYVHNIHNSGNTKFTDINLSSKDTLDTGGWTSVLYEDTDGNGVLSSGDLPVGSFDLDIGKSKTIFAKVFAPANAPLGATNLTYITAIGTTDAGTPVKITVKAQDMTIVAMSNMSITKRQAPDVNCDGVVDSGFAYSFDTFQAQPRTCVLYNLTATNTSSSVARNVRIDDAIPEFTSHFTDGGLLPTITQGNIVIEPADGDTGLVEGNAGVVNSGESVSLVFGVMVE